MDTQTPALGAAGLKKAAPVVVACVVLIVGFFLPWINFFGSPVGGYQIYDLWSWGYLLWAAAIVALLAIGCAYLGKPSGSVGKLAAALVLVFFVIAVFKFGGDIFSKLGVGAWLSIVSSVFLIAHGVFSGSQSPSDEANQ